MRRSGMVEWRDEYLPDVSPAGLEETYGRGRPGKSGGALRAAMLRATDALGKVCGIAGRPASAACGGFRRLKRGGLGRRHDQKSPGRRRSLTPKQECVIKEDLGRPPNESVCDRAAGTFGCLPNSYITDSASYVAGGRRWGLPAGSAFPSASPGPRRATAPLPWSGRNWSGRRGAPSPDGRRRAAPHYPYMMPRCGIRRVSRKSLHPRGERDMVCTNHSRKSINLIGASGLQFHQNPKAGIYIALLEFARRRHKRIGIVVCRKI